MKTTPISLVKRKKTLRLEVIRGAPFNYQCVFHTDTPNASSPASEMERTTQARLAGLRATHLHFRPEQNPEPAVDHPIVCTHPETGRKTLFVSPNFAKNVVGMTKDESETLLETLFAHQTRDEYIWTHEWRVGDLVLWDNRATMHRREPFPDAQRRILKRTQIFSETRPVA